MSEGEADDVREQGFASRWSARKREARLSEQTDHEDPHTVGSPALLPEPTTDVELSDSSTDTFSVEGQAEPLDLPDLETLDADSDYSGFLHPEVDKQLRKAALRKLFSLPQFGLRDGLDDYDDDFTVFEPLGDTVTCDMRFHEARKKAEAEAREREEAEAAEAAEIESGSSPDDQDDEAVSEARTDPEPGVATTDEELDAHPDLIENDMPGDAVSPRNQDNTSE